MKPVIQVCLDQYQLSCHIHLDQDVTREKLAAGDALLPPRTFQKPVPGDNDFPYKLL